MFDEKAQIIVITTSCFGPTEELSVVTFQSLCKWNWFYLLPSVYFDINHVNCYSFVFKDIFTQQEKREIEILTRESFCNKKSSILTCDIRLDFAFNERMENEILPLVIDLQLLRGERATYYCKTA